MYINGEEEVDFTPSVDAEYNEAAGEYSVVLPVETYQPGQMNEIALTCLDYAFNGTTDILYTEAQSDAAVVFSNINNDDSLSVLRDVSYLADYDYLISSYVNITDCVAQIRGIASASVRSLSVNGQEAVFDEHNGFRLALSVEEPGLLTLHVEAKDAEGNVVFQADKPALFDVQKPAATSYVCDENGEWDNSMLWTSDHTVDGYLLATRYEKDQLVPLLIQVTDESLTRVTVSWLEGTMSDQDFSYWLMGYDVEAEVHTQELAPDSFDENGRLTMNVPFAYKESIYVDEETGEVYDNSAWCQIVRVRAYDAAGHVTTCNALLYDTVYGQQMYEESGFKDARYSDGTIRGDILALEPLWNQEDAKLTDTRFFITDDMLDENGNLHVRATLDRDANLVVFNDNVYLPQEGSRQVEFTDEATGTATTVAFTVVKDTAAPEAPVIAQGGDGKVTLTAAEEDVTLYYSYDGTEWVLYTGPFAPTATPVYAKAVDRAGNESAVSRLAVQVAASQPVQTGDAAPVAVYTALLLTAAAALAAAPVLRRRRVK